MRRFRFAAVIAGAMLMSGCFLLPKTPITLNGTTLLFGKIDSISVGKPDSVTFSGGSFGGGDFVIKSSEPITINGQEVSVVGSSVSIGGNKFEVGDDYQVIVDRNGGIKLELMKTKIIAPPE